jgi:hypothetical protein
MNISRWGLLALCFAAAPSFGYTKPPDLPNRSDVRCEDRDKPAPRQSAIETQQQSGEVAPVCIDVWAQGMMPFIVQRLCQQMFSITQPNSSESIQFPVRDASAETVRRGGVIAVVATDPELTTTAEQARELYELASRFARQGNLDRARACLRQAHLANPTCRFGRLAIERLQELEAPATGEETSEPTPPRTDPRPGSTREPNRNGDNLTESERVFKRIRQSTQPLGLVPGTTY